MIADIDRASILYYSDDPEELSAAKQGRADGVLFDFDITVGKPQRFVFYHVNRDEAPRKLVLRFLNQGSATTRLSYVRSLPPGGTDYMKVGHASTFGFLRSLSDGETKSTTIPPDGNVEGETITLATNELASGIFEFTLTGTGPLRCSLISTALGEDPIAIAHRGLTFRPNGFGRRGKFDISDKTPIMCYVAVDVPTVIARLGQRRFANLERPSHGVVGNALKGEYGVFTAIKLTLVNRNENDCAVALYESAHGGKSTASFFIDGNLVESGVMQCSDVSPRYKVKTYQVPRNGNVTSSILTMPDNASSSPVVLTIGRLDPESPDPDEPGSIIAYR